MKMEENAELEEGEAPYHWDDDHNIDLDSLSYIDERINHLLGHFQKNFEGSVSTENLGAKFDGYGSFLPTYEYSPSQSHPKTPQRNHSLPKSHYNIPMEADSHNSKAPPNAPPSIRRGAAFRSAHSFQNLGVHSVDGSMKQDRGLPSNRMAEICPSKDDRTSKSGYSTDQRTLKFRIKVNSDNLARKNAAIYSGLGLDNSPSSSMGNSNEESGGMAPLSREIDDESPTGIIKDMTSFPIMGGVLISPLHDNLLYLIEKGKILGASRSVSSLNDHQEHCSMYTDESDSFAGDGELLKKREVRNVGQSERKLELKYTNCNNIENDVNLHAKKRIGSRTPECKEFLSNGLKCTPLSSSVYDAGETAEVTCKVSEFSKEVNKDGLKGQRTLIEAIREEALQSIFGQDFDKSEKQCVGISSAEKSSEQKLVNSQQDKNSTYPMYNGKCKANKISKEAEHDIKKFKAADQNPQKYETYEKGKPSVEGKNKTKGDQSASTVAVSRKDSSGACNNVAITDKKSPGCAVASIKSKMQKTKSLKDNNVRGGKRGSLKGKKSKWAVNEMLPVNGPPAHIPISAALDTFEERNEFGFKTKERPSVNKLNNQLIVGPCVEDDLHVDSISENKLALGMVPAAAAVPLVIEENWVCCDRCEKWRLLPLGTKPDQLPENWLCSILDWLPGMNRCEILEDETTNVMRALHQKQISEGQNITQNHATRTAIGVSSVDALHTGLNHQNPRSDVLSDRGKKKHGFMEKIKAGSSSDLFLTSNSTKNDAQESGKNRSLTNTNHNPAGLNPLKKSSAKHLSKLHNSVAGKHMLKEKESQINGGDRKLVKLKRKVETDQNRSGTTKKFKTEDLCYADGQPNSGMGLEKAGLNSRNGLPKKASGKDMQKYDKYCLSEDEKHKLVVSVKKQGEKAQFLSDGGSLDVTNNSERDDSCKKRKLKDSKESIKHNDTFLLQDGKPYEENIVSGFTKEKKYKVLNAKAKSVTERDDNLNREGRVSQVCFPSSRDHLAVGTEVRSVDNAQQRRKHREKIVSQQVLYSIDPLGRSGCRQLSLAANSSSSKVSGSNKARTNFEDVKGSPVESVTSSPVRTSNLDRLQFVGGDTQGKDAAARGGLSLMVSKRSLDNKERKQPMKTRERVSYDLHSESPKFSLIESHVGDAIGKARVLATSSSEVRNNDLLNGGVDAEEQHSPYANVTYRVDKVNKNKQETAPSWQKSDKVMSLWGNKERSGSEFDQEKMNVSALENGYSKNGKRYKSASEPSHKASGHEARNDTKICSHNNSTAKRNSVRHLSSASGKQTELKQEDTENSVLKVDPYSTNTKILNEQNLVEGLKEKNKADPAHTESRDEKLKVLSSLEGKEKRGKLFMDSRTTLRSQKRDMSDAHPLQASGNGDMTKIIKSTADTCGKGETNPSSGNFGSDRQLTVSSPVRASSSETAFDTLKEARKLKDRAEFYKNSGFGFESKETYFEAALKFLQGASALENFHSESSKHGEMSPMQIYSSTVKLLESCANEYEKDGEMATAALVYKCMEVAYMRVVYCKNSSTNKDRHEWQSTLPMVPQGESPSSSASDIDNLNNQGAVDHRATLPRGTGTHVAGNQVITSRSRPSFVRILDFVHDMILAMDASRKCQCTFEAANRVMQDARNKDCITSIRSVIDSSFQDVDELVCLVWIARKDISRARD